MSPKSRAGVILPSSTLTVDVGLHTAVGDWLGSKYPSMHEINCPPRLTKLENRINWMCSRFEDILDDTGPHSVLIEGAAFWDGSLKSRTSASRGDTFWLAYLAGAYARSSQRVGAVVKIIDARQWKGTMSDEAVAMRVRRINGEEYKTPHLTDAVGMGFSYYAPDAWSLKVKI